MSLTWSPHAKVTRFTFDSEPERFMLAGGALAERIPGCGVASLSSDGRGWMTRVSKARWVHDRRNVKDRRVVGEVAAVAAVTSKVEEAVGEASDGNSMERRAEASLSSETRSQNSVKDLPPRALSDSSIFERSMRCLSSRLLRRGVAAAVESLAFILQRGVQSVRKAVWFLFSQCFV